MTRTPRTRTAPKAVVAAALTIPLLLGASACGGDDDSSTDTSAASSAQSAPSSAEAGTTAQHTPAPAGSTSATPTGAAAEDGSQCGGTVQIVEGSVSCSEAEAVMEKLRQKVAASGVRSTVMYMFDGWHCMTTQSGTYTCSKGDSEISNR